jgi:hypothetical protein
MSGPSHAFEWFIANPLAFLAAIGVILYGLLRFSYGLFYRQLGTSPEEVGLSYQTILAQSLLGVVAVVVGFTIVIVVYAIATLFYMEVLRRSTGLVRRILRDVGAGVGGAVSGIALLARVVESLLAVAISPILGTLISKKSAESSAPPTTAGEPTASDGAPTQTPTSIESMLAELQSKQFLEHVPTVLGPGARNVALLFVISVIALLLIVLPLAAGNYATRVQSGEAVEGFAIGPFTLLGIRADPSRITYTGDGEVNAWDSSCLMYLGQASGVTSLYKPKENRLLRIPSTVVLLETLPRGSSCDDD